MSDCRPTLRASQGILALATGAPITLPLKSLGGALPPHFPTPLSPSFGSAEAVAAPQHQSTGWSFVFGFHGLPEAPSTLEVFPPFSSQPGSSSGFIPGSFAPNGSFWLR